MTLAPLATSDDLTAHGITSDGDDAAALAAASSAIRTAAENVILQKTSTVTRPAPRGTFLRLPGPVVSVASVTVDGDPWTEGTHFYVGPEGLTAVSPWSWAELPVPVVVTFTHGLAVVPEDIVDLCCSLAAAWKTAKADGFAADPGGMAFKVDDYAESRSAEAAGQVSPVWIPETTKAELKARFGGGAMSVEMG